jgi:hypothetical protein
VIDCDRKGFVFERLREGKKNFQYKVEDPSGLVIEVL